MVLHKKTLNFFQPSSSKSIVIDDDDVSCSSHSDMQQDLNKPLKRPSLYIWPGYNITFCLKIYSKGQSKSTFVQIGWGQMKSNHIIFSVKSRQGEGGGSKMETFEQIYFLNGPPISYIFQLFHHLLFRNRHDTHISLSI